MNVVHVTIAGKRTTATVPPVAAAIAFVDGWASLDSWAASVVVDRKLWAWSARFSDSVSGRLTAVAVRQGARRQVARVLDMVRVDADGYVIIYPRS